MESRPSRAMQLALEKMLNGPVLHGGTHLLSLEDSHNRKWLEAYRARRAGNGAHTRKLVGELTAGYVGITDVPGAHFLPELLELYPDARVVLVARDPQRWAQSVGHVRKHTDHAFLRYFMAPMPSWHWIPALLDGSFPRANDAEAVDRVAKKVFTKVALT